MTELRELAASGAKGLFYNSQLDLNQGAYLTEVTAGKRLPNADGVSDVKRPEARSYTVDNAAESLFLDREEIEDILLLWTAKKNVILQGPPGLANRSQRKGWRSPGWAPRIMSA